MIKIVWVVPGTPGKGYRPILPPYGAMYLAAMTPKELNGEEVCVRVVIEACAGQYDVRADPPDVLCLSCMTPGAPRAYEIARMARECVSSNGRAPIVMMGGVHATFLPQEAVMSGVNITVRSEVSPPFMTPLLEAALAMSPNDHFVTRDPDAFRMAPGGVAVDWTGHDRKSSLLIGLQTGTGCPFDCEFCVAPLISGSGSRYRPLSVIEAELATMPRGTFLAILDDNFLPGVNDIAINRCLEVARLIHNRRFRWVAELTARTLRMALAKRPRFLEELRELGCVGFYFGLETVGKENSNLKKVDNPDDVLGLIHQCHATGLMVLGAFVFGVGPDETPDHLERVLDFAINQAMLDYLQTTIAFAPPGTELWRQALNKRPGEIGSLLSADWRDYDGTRSTIKHSLPPEVLEEMLCEAHRRFYDWKGIATRLLHPENLRHPFAWVRRVPLSLPVNLKLGLDRKSWEEGHRAYQPARVPPTPEQMALFRECQRTPFIAGNPDDGISVPLGRKGVSVS